MIEQIDICSCKLVVMPMICTRWNDEKTIQNYIMHMGKMQSCKNFNQIQTNANNIQYSNLKFWSIVMVASIGNLRKDENVQFIRGKLSTFWSHNH